MRGPIRAMLALSVMGGLAACAPAGQSGPTGALTAADEAAIRANTDAWNSAYNAGDADKIVALYADDAVVMPPDVTALATRAALKDFLVRDMAGAKAAGISTKDDGGVVRISGDMAWHAGQFSASDASGKKVSSGKYVEIWQKTAGRWLMVRDIWNNDAAAPAEPPK